MRNRLQVVVLAAAIVAAGCGKDNAASSSTSGSVGTNAASGSTHSSSTGGTTATSSASTGGTTAGNTATSTSSTGTHSSSASTGSAGTTGSTGTSATSTSTSTSGGGNPADVLMHHKDPHRTGVYVDAAFTAAAVPSIQLDATFDGSFTGQVYAQPLFISGLAGAPDLVIVATESNDVFAFNAVTGAQVWTQHLGDSWPLSDLSCGNIDPNGVTGTGVIDPDTRTFYVDGLVHNVGHEVFAFDVDTGAPRAGWPFLVDGNATSNGHTFNVDDNGNAESVQQQRAALGFINGVVYVPFGGFYGDCGDYHGWLVAIDGSNATLRGAWATRGRGGAIWGPSGPAMEGGHLFVTTGNTFVSSDWEDGEALVDLGPDAAFDPDGGNYWAPTNWKALDNADIDMSGTNPLLFDLGGLHTALAMGKDGKFYVLDRDNLGGITNALTTYQASSDEIINAAADIADAQGQLVFYVSRPIDCPTGSGNLGAVRIVPGSPPTITPLWCADEQDGLPGGGSPIITSSDGTNDLVVWGIGAGGSNALLAWDAETGAVLFDGTGSATDNLHRFIAPIEAKGRIYVAADNRLESYVLP